eukprot:m.175277 g.175277  ORF g.175277 m.175277 type:complete len:400 (+) comp16774_c0_seq6:63-1262(+)
MRATLHCHVWRAVAASTWSRGRSVLVASSHRHASTQAALRGVITRVQPLEDLGAKLYGQISAEVQLDDRSVIIEGQLPMIYEGEAVAINHAAKQASIRLQPTQLELQPLLESLSDFPAFVKYLKQHQLHGITAIAAERLSSLPQDVLKQAICDSLQGIPTQATLTRSQPLKLARRLKQLADVRILHILAMTSPALHNLNQRLKLIRDARDQLGEQAGPLLVAQPSRIQELSSVSSLQASLFMSDRRPLPLVSHQQNKVHAILTQLERRLATGRALVSLEDLIRLSNTSLLSGGLEQHELLTLTELNQLHQHYPGWLTILRDTRPLHVDNVTTNNIFVMPTKLCQTESYVKEQLALLRQREPLWFQPGQRPPRLLLPKPGSCQMLKPLLFKLCCRIAWQC